MSTTKQYFGQMVLIACVLIAIALFVSVVNNHSTQVEQVSQIETISLVQEGEAWALKYHMKDGKVLVLRDVQALICAADEE